MLLILEGPDGAGKSTLAEQLKELLPGLAVVHHGPGKGLNSRQLCSTYMASLRPALAGQDLVLDRSWISEPIYGEVFRNDPVGRVSRAQRRMLERAALRCQGIVILCLPPFARCLAAFSSGREEMLESEAQLAHVYALYHDEVLLKTALPVVFYDFETCTAPGLLEVCRLRQWTIPKVILLGDRAMVRSPLQEPLVVPFASFTGVGCSEWLAEQLDSEKIPEDALCWFNAYQAEGSPLDPGELPAGLPIVALGKNAQQWCREHARSHEACPHPQAHRRFYHGKRYPLLDILKRILT